jgi:hypothetical protein
MSVRAQAVRLLALAVVGAAAVAGASSAVHAATGAAAPRSPAASAGERAAAARALQRVFRTSGPLPFERVAGSGVRRVGGVPINLSDNWSGYADDNSTGRTYSSVTATWVQPKIRCTAAEDELAAYWVGLDGFTTGTVEQDGTFGWCYQGTAYYFTWWEMYPNGAITMGNAVGPGDHITASVTSTSLGYRLAVTDSTRRANSFVTTQPCAVGTGCANASAEWIAETPGGARGLWPWPQFGTWHPTSARVTSGTRTGTIKSFPDDQIYLVGDDGDALDNTGNLSRSGNAFSLAWTAAY